MNRNSKVDRKFDSIKVTHHKDVHSIKFLENVTQQRVKFDNVKEQ